jgi:hypothetical protein
MHARSIFGTIARLKMEVCALVHGDPRVGKLAVLLRCETVVIGTSRHFAALQNLSAIGVTADMPNGFSKVKS